jgi:hypothetical protein
LKLKYQAEASVVSFLMTRTSKKITELADSVSIVNWVECFRWLRKFCNHSGPRGQPTNVSSVQQKEYVLLFCDNARQQVSQKIKDEITKLG